MSSLGVILPAAGRSVRFGGNRNKLFELLDGKPVVTHAVEAFLTRQDVAALVIVTGDPRAIAQVLPQPLDPRITFCKGGDSRAESVRNGLASIDRAVEWIAVHDAARPLVSQGLIGRTLEVAKEHGAAVPAMPVHLTIKQATGPLPAAVQRTIPRNTLWAMQTPQIMRRSALEAAFEQCPLPLDAVTDDVQLLELAGHPVWLVEGEERNLKITTHMDLQIAELLVQGK
ncbi:MAG TPA: 2-C-methyl-D-erythritol 4-phosphate cytidylyltransferase [Tepidisphaeraceae bacterium]|nr:2-C-methyl-D-erythritol 4-phosphate cytidylyltransferase [Tepidisphaeraceae bacterium]